MTNTPIPPESLSLRVYAKRHEAEGVISLDLRTDEGAELPRFTAGSHIDLEIPARGQATTLLRQYSLCNAPSERHRYVVGIGRDPTSRGGSVYLHDELDTGQVLRISVPRNHFGLDELADHSILIAGGIGITPLLAMARRLSALGRRWTLYYCVRTPQRAAFLADLLALAGGEVIPIFDGVPGVASLDLPTVVAAASAGAHFYCCGPTPLMKAFEAATAQRAPETVHVEWFKARGPEPTAAAAIPGAFTLHLARTEKTLSVPANKSVLDVLREAGVAVPSSCCDGICGTCETKVLQGTPDHRDSVLSRSEQAAGDRMMVCVSRCKGADLTLDL